MDVITLDKFDIKHLPNILKPGMKIAILEKGEDLRPLPPLPFEAVKAYCPVDEENVNPGIPPARPNPPPPHRIDFGTRGAPGNQGHYDGEVQPIDLAFAQNLNYSEGAEVKYICRWRRKGNGVEDLKKAIWHLEQLIKQEEKNA